MRRKQPHCQTIKRSTTGLTNVFRDFFSQKILQFKIKAITLHRKSKKRTLKCENSSVGRAQPCQGWGRGFESRFSLKFLKRTLKYHRFSRALSITRENSSVGRAQPCQGWGRGFESRFSLRFCQQAQSSEKPITSGWWNW